MPDFDLNIFLLQHKAIWIGHKFNNLDRPLPYTNTLYIEMPDFEMYTLFFFVETQAKPGNSRSFPQKDTIVISDDEDETPVVVKHLFFNIYFIVVYYHDL